MKYLKKFNESLEEEGFELSSHEQRNNSRSLFKSLEFTDEEKKQISLVVGNKWFEGGTRVLYINKGEKQIYFDKYDDNWYYVLYYEHYNANAIIYKCSEFEGLINCLNSFINKI
jgi:hypothetical protein